MTKNCSWWMFALLLAVSFGTASLLLSPLKVENTDDLSEYPWVFLRDNQIPSSEEHLASIIIVGDITFGRGIREGRDHLRLSKGWLRSADLTLGNLEGVISQKEVFRYCFDTVKNPYILCSTPMAVAELKEAGFDILGLANNHAGDLGACGLSDTVQVLRAFGIEPGGVQKNFTHKITPVLRNVGNARVAFFFVNMVSLNFSILEGDPQFPRCTLWHVISWEDQKELISAIQSIRLQVDVVIVSIHWGYEYETQEAPLQQYISRNLIEAGADVIIGHHPHVIQGVEIIFRSPQNDQGIVLYSLGNFLFDQQTEKTKVALVSRLLVDGKGLRAVQILPIQAGGLPRLLSLVEVMTLSSDHEISEEIVFQCSEKDCYQIHARLNPSEGGLFWFGEIDLTGDQLPEKVQRMQKRLVIVQEKRPVWISPEDWQINDVALGDPDRDGRNEVILAFWKPDQEGHLRSHPFIIGYRGGIYQTLWGGSAVHNPILEIELSDIDGDLQQELVVLEQVLGSKHQTISVWRWHGWGFSLFWRSPMGYYENLRIVYREEEKRNMIVVKRKFFP